MIYKEGYIIKTIVVTGIGMITGVGNNAKDSFSAILNGKTGVDTITYFDTKNFGRRNNFTGQHFWARGYHVSTVGRDEAMIGIVLFKI